MWIYQKHLQYPVRVDRPNPALAKVVVAQYGGPDGELGASLRYLTQRYTMPMPEARAALTGETDTLTRAYPFGYSHLDIARMAGQAALCVILGDA